MITGQLIKPDSIAVICSSSDPQTDGGVILANLKATFHGDIHAVIPGESGVVSGVRSYGSVGEIPSVDCALLSIPASECADAVDELVNRKNCRAVVIMSSGFRETGAEGCRAEIKIKELCDKSGAALIGPNCTGLVTPYYAGTFRTQIPELDRTGAALVSASGSTIVYILELAAGLGLTFNSLYSVGNSAQNGVEDILKYIDETYIPGKGPKVVMLYMESVSRPGILMKHSSSLISKGVRICAMKAGTSDTGRQAASLHTGAIASPDKAVDALFRKTGIVRCWSRTEFVFVAAAMMLPPLKGHGLAVISQSGGPAILQTDVFASSGLNIPKIEGPEAEYLLSELDSGASISNPIDMLSSATASQLDKVIGFCERDCPGIDAMTVIWGSRGDKDAGEVCDVLLRRMRTCSKPIYVMLAASAASSERMVNFHRNGAISFPDEVLLARTLVKISEAEHYPTDNVRLPPVDKQRIRDVILHNGSGYLQQEQVQILLDAAGISRVTEAMAYSIDEALEAVREIGGYPVALKAIGPLHKPDVNGTSLDIREDLIMKNEFERMMKIPETTGILFQKMLSGIEIFIGAKKEDSFGHLIMCGLGGVFVEVLNDICTGLSPLSAEEADAMLRSLKAFPILKGYSAGEGVNLRILNETIRRVSALCEAAPEIMEMDINPLLGCSDSLVAVDARILIQKD